jgi:glycosyltransferase involved in cell wall biosynthesis
MRIAYLSALDPRNIRAWSGLHATIFRQLQQKCGDVTPLGPHNEPGIMRNGRIYSLLSRKLTGKRFDYTHSLKLAQAYGKFFSARLKQGDYDAVFATSASTELAFLETKLPVFYTSDATFANVLNYYPFYTNLMARSIAEGNEIQQRALEKCTQLFFPSEWAANSAAQDYKISRDKIQVVPYGANLADVPLRLPTHTVEQNTVRLLFVGVEWERKGGPIAIAAMQALRAIGWNATLTIVGCKPKIHEQGVLIIPFLDKNDPAQRKQLTELFSEADFFILPTTAECFGLVFCEASAMGTPSLAPDTGGVGGVVHNGINGFLLRENCTGKDYADKIVELITGGNYDALRKSSRALYESKLNWEAWGNEVARLVRI